MTVADAVIRRFGGIASLARALGHRHRSTVQGWGEEGRIPMARWPDIERVALTQGFQDITVAWLAEQHAEQLTRPKARA